MSVILVKDADTLAQAHSVKGNSIVVLLPADLVDNMDVIEDELDAMEEILHKNIVAISSDFLPDLMEIEEGIANLY